MKFRFRIKELIKEKEVRENKRYTYARIGRETGLHSGRVKAYADNNLTRYDAKYIEAFLTFFDCSICDLFEDVDDSQ